MNRHPGDEEAAKVKAKYKQKVCSYGDSCQTEGCLYFHPYEAESDVTSAVDRLELADTDGNQELISYEEWLAQSCPAPSHLDANQINNVWFYSSGLQRDPWEVYNLMYPDNSSGFEHTAAPNLWEPLTSTSQLGGLTATSQLWNPGVDQINSDPTSFEEWKKKGCHYPTWFQSDIDPWYDDEGMRRSLEDVYELLYGENAQARFEEKEALRYQLETQLDPTPAELLMNGDNTQKQVDSNSNNRTSAKPGGWASVASRPASAPISNRSTNSNAITPSNSKATKTKTIIMPNECWLPSTDNSNYFVSHPNPIERYCAINKRHEQHLQNVTIPTSMEGSSPAEEWHLWMFTFNLPNQSLLS